MNRALVALLLLLVYKGLAFGVRTLQHRRQTGRSGFLGFSGKPGSASWFGGVLFGFAMVLALLGPCLELAGVVASFVEASTAVTTIGITLTVAGIASTYAAQVAMGRSWRVGVRETERTTLVTSGPFRLVRNPIFTFMLMTLAGIVVLLPNVLTIGSFVGLFLAVELQVRAVEEPYLFRTHGAEYADYCAKVGRFVPGMGLRAFPK